MISRPTQDLTVYKMSLAHPAANYDYSGVEYVKAILKVKVGCPLHGDFWVTPNNHLRGKGCPKCGVIKNANGIKRAANNKRPDLSHIKTPPGSKVVPVGTKGDYALVDDEDYDRVMGYNWCYSEGYAVNDFVGRMHRFILNTPEDKVTDHINHNRLDNRRCNIRVCTQQENMCNTRRNSGSSKYRGVTFNKVTNSWMAQIGYNKKHFYLGHLSEEIEADRSYDEAA